MAVTPKVIAQIQETCMSDLAGASGTLTFMLDITVIDATTATNLGFTDTLLDSDVTVSGTGAVNSFDVASTLKTDIANQLNLIHAGTITNATNDIVIPGWGDIKITPSQSAPPAQWPAEGKVSYTPNKGPKKGFEKVLDHTVVDLSSDGLNYNITNVYAEGKMYKAGTTNYFYDFWLFPGGSLPGTVTSATAAQVVTGSNGVSSLLRADHISGFNTTTTALVPALQGIQRISVVLACFQDTSSVTKSKMGSIERMLIRFDP